MTSALSFRMSVLPVLGALLLAFPVLGSGAWAAPPPGQEEAPIATDDEAVGEVLEQVEESLDSVEPDKVYRGGEVSLFTSIHIPANEVHRGEVVCIGCEAVIEGEVTRDIVVVGGDLTLTGKAGHDVVCVMSNVELGEDAEIEHDFVNVMGTLDDSGAQIGNERFNLEMFTGLPSIKTGFGVLGAIITWGRILKLILLFVVILILAVFVPERIRTISDEIPVSLGLAFLAGLAGYVVLWVVNTLLAISLIGIPVAILLHLVFLVLKTLGLAGLFHYIGCRIGRGLSREMSLLGAILLGFIPFAVILIVPHFFGIIGFIAALSLRLLFWLLLELPAVGLFILTRAGGRPRALPMFPAAPQPPPPPSATPPPPPPAAP